MGGTIDMSLCSCCNGIVCQKIADDFERADNIDPNVGTPGPTYTELVGNWDIVSGKLVTTVGGSSIRITGLWGWDDFQITVRGDSAGEIISFTPEPAASLRPQVFYVCFGAGGYIGYNNSLTSQFTKAINIPTGSDVKIRLLCGILYVNGTACINLGSLQDCATMQANFLTVTAETIVTKLSIADFKGGYRHGILTGASADSVDPACGTCSHCAWILSQGITTTVTLIITGVPNDIPSGLPTLSNLNGTYVLTGCVDGVGNCFFYKKINIAVDGTPANNVTYITINLHQTINPTDGTSGNIVVTLYKEFDPTAIYSGICKALVDDPIGSLAAVTASVITYISWGGAGTYVNNNHSINPLTLPDSAYGSSVAVSY